MTDRNASAVSVEPLMTDLEDQIRGERRARMMARGGASDYRDPEIFAGVEARVSPCSRHPRPRCACCCRELLDDVEDYTLHLRLRYAEPSPRHRTGADLHQAPDPAADRCGGSTSTASRTSGGSSA